MQKRKAMLLIGFREPPFLLLFKGFKDVVLLLRSSKKKHLLNFYKGVLQGNNDIIKQSSRGVL